MFVAAGGGLSTSTDGITWTARTSGTVSALSAAIYANNLYLYGGAGGVLATSTTSELMEYSNSYNVTTEFYVASATQLTPTITPVPTNTVTLTASNYVRAK